MPITGRCDVPSLLIKGSIENWWLPELSDQSCSDSLEISAPWTPVFFFKITAPIRGRKLAIWWFRASRAVLKGGSCWISRLVGILPARYQLPICQLQGHIFHHIGMTRGTDMLPLTYSTKCWQPLSSSRLMYRGNGFVQPKKVDSIGRLLGHIRVTMCNQLSVDAPRVGGGCFATTAAQNAGKFY